MRYVIVGGSIAGLACAGRIRELDSTSDVLILSEEARPYSKMALPSLLAGEMREEHIWLDVPADVQFQGQEDAVRIEPARHIVITSRDREVGYNRLLIASGAGASPPDFEGSHCDGVFTVRNMSDIQGIQESLKSAKRGKVIISGAGLVSMEMGDALLKKGFKPIYLVSSQKILSQILDEGGSDFLKQYLPAKGAEFHFGQSIKRVHESDAGIVVRTVSGNEFEGDFLVVGKGAVPNTGYLAASGIALDDGVLVDEYLKTSHEDIFAAGDVCQAFDMMYNEKRVNALWPVAIEQGRHAAMNMTSYHEPYQGSISRNVVTIFGTVVFAAGLSRSTDLESYQRQSSNRYARIMLKDGRLAGAVFINVRIDPGCYLLAMQSRTEIAHLKDVLLSGSLSYVHLHPFLTASRIF